jgi:hypothetical protein
VKHPGSQDLRRWRYAKRCNVITDEIHKIFRTRGSETQVLHDGKWQALQGHAKTEFDAYQDLELLTPTEIRNLLVYLRTGQTDIPPRLDLEPRERYQKWKCPDCGTFTVVPVVVGLPSSDDDLAAREGHLILQGCIVYGDEPDQAVACTNCDWFGELIGNRTIRQIPRTEAFRNIFNDFDESDEERGLS